MRTQQGYFDIQINGYGGVDFNKDDLNADELHAACKKLAEDGNDQFLATVITEALDRMEHCLAGLVKLREQDDLAKRMIAGFHIEGPFINEQPGYVGAHPPDAVMPADPDAMKRLLDAAGGLTKIVTLAPERDPDYRVTTMLSKMGIVASAGHCDPSLDELRGGIDAGITMFTHLGNGCLMHMHRHDNIIQRSLSLADRLWCCFIADGAHVAYPALGNYIKCAGIDRCIVTTDAMPAAGLGPGRYTIGRWDLKIGEDLVARAPDGSHLIGSCLHLSKVGENLISQVGLTEDQVHQLTKVNPRRALGMC